VAALKRGRQWWFYCPEHMYGRWIEDGRVMEWFTRKDEAIIGRLPDGALARLEPVGRLTDGAS
jgi:hypothetical protein